MGNKETIIKSIIQEYPVSKEEMDSILNKARKMTFQGKKPKVEGQATFVNIGGQPGAGKTGLVTKTLKEFKEKKEEAIITDINIYRSLFEKFPEIARKYPQYYQEVTFPLLIQINNKMIEEGIDAKYNIIDENTMTSKDTIKGGLLAESAGYKVEGKIMATSIEKSIISVFLRYIRQLENMGFGRLTPIASVDRRYLNLCEIAKLLERKKMSMEVYIRGENESLPKKIYTTGDETYYNVVQAIESGRTMDRKDYLPFAEQELKIVIDRLKGDTRMQESLEVLDRRIMEFVNGEKLI